MFIQDNNKPTANHGSMGARAAPDGHARHAGWRTEAQRLSLPHILLGKRAAIAQQPARLANLLPRA